MFQGIVAHFIAVTAHNNGTKKRKRKKNKGFTFGQTKTRGGSSSQDVLIAAKTIMDVCLHLPFWTSLHHVYKTLCFLLHFEFKREPGSNKQAIKVLLFWCNYPCRETQAHKYIFFFLSAHKNQPKLFLFIELKIL